MTGPNSLFYAFPLSFRVAFRRCVSSRFGARGDVLFYTSMKRGWAIEFGGVEAGEIHASLWLWDSIHSAGFYRV